MKNSNFCYNSFVLHKVLLLRALTCWINLTRTQDLTLQRRKLVRLSFRLCYWRTKCSYSVIYTNVMEVFTNSQRLLSISKSQFGGRVTNLEPLQKLYMSIKQEQAEFWKLHPSVIKKFEAQNLLELAPRLLEELMKWRKGPASGNFYSIPRRPSAPSSHCLLRNGASISPETKGNPPFPCPTVGVATVAI